MWVVITTCILPILTNFKPESLRLQLSIPIEYQKNSLTESYYLLKHNFLHRESIPERLWNDLLSHQSNKIKESVISHYINQFNDPYTKYIPKSLISDRQTTIRGDSGSIGFKVSRKFQFSPKFLTSKISHSKTISNFIETLNDRKRLYLSILSPFFSSILMSFTIYYKFSQIYIATKHNFLINLLCPSLVLFGATLSMLIFARFFLPFLFPLKVTQIYIPIRNEISSSELLPPTQSLFQPLSSSFQLPPTILHPNSVFQNKQFIDSTSEVFLHTSGTEEAMPPEEKERVLVGDTILSIQGQETWCLSSSSAQRLLDSTPPGVPYEGPSPYDAARVELLVLRNQNPPSPALTLLRVEEERGAFLKESVGHAYLLSTQSRGIGETPHPSHLHLHLLPRYLRQLRSAIQMARQIQSSHISSPSPPLTPLEFEVPSLVEVGLGVGYLRVDRFTSHTPSEIIEKISEFKKLCGTPCLQGLILDLRSNRGGSVQAAIQTAALFLPTHTPIVQIIGHLASPLPETFESLNPTPDASPLLLLLSPSSASSSELLALALRASGRAALIGLREEVPFPTCGVGVSGWLSNFIGAGEGEGIRTVGKDKIQVVVSLVGGGGLSLTSRQFRGPHGESLSGGLQMDMEWK